jgi:MSHA biogenesis protein MshG
MEEMTYKAYDKNGVAIRGTTKGESEQDIFLRLRKKGLYLVELSPLLLPPSARATFEKLNKINLTRWMYKVKLEEIIAFTRQFHTLFKAGLSIDVLLNTLIKQTQNKILKETLSAIQEDLQNGLSLAKAFAKHPKIFDKLYTSMLLAGEEAGILEQALQELMNVLEKENKLRHDVASATLYPKIVLGVMGMGFYTMITFIIPKFASFYDKFQATLPLPTRILIAMGNFSSHYWYIVLGLIGLIGFLFHRFLRTRKGRLQWDLFKLSVPIFGDLFKKIAMARFAHLFAALYRSGLPLVRSFEVLAHVIGNEVYVLEINRFREGLMKGKSISEVIRTAQHFSVMMVETTAVGEQSGNLDTMLISMAEYYDQEVTHMTKNLTTFIEPILLLLMAGMVLLMALGIYLPMWNLSKVILNH